MAFVTNIHCCQCDKVKHEVRHPDFNPLNPICLECRNENANKEKRMYLASLKGLTLEERIEKIEQWIYENRNIKNYTRDIRY